MPAALSRSERIFHSARTARAISLPSRIVAVIAAIPGRA